MPFDFSNQRVVIAGGSRGIGRSIALGFAATRAELARFGATAHAATCDLADGAAVARYIGEAANALGGIDVLVNNASGFGATEDEAGWETSIAVDLMATVRASRAALPFIEQSTAASSIYRPSPASARRCARRRMLR